MKIERIEQKEEFWRKVIDYAEHCSWQGGKYLAEDMEKNFSDWECVFAAVEKGKIAGYCAVLKRDCINDVPYTPYIGYVFVVYGCAHASDFISPDTNSSAHALNAQGAPARDYYLGCGQPPLAMDHAN